MSILKTVSDGGDSVLEHFYDEDNHEVSNWRLDIFLVGTNNYTRVVRVHDEPGHEKAVR